MLLKKKGVQSSVLKFTEPSACSYRLSHSAFGKYQIMCDKRIHMSSVTRHKTKIILMIFNGLLFLQRESGLKVFRLFINKLDTEAKHKFFR